MALPKLNATPSHEMVQPSTGERVSYRPYLVKEEKILLLAFESNDQKQAMRAMIDTVVTCCENVDKDELTVFDVEYMFTQIRSRSVGESSQVQIKCENEECGKMSAVDINLQEINVDVPDMEKVVELTPTVSIELKWPSFDDFLINFDNDMSETEFGFKMVAKCIGAILTEDERIDAKEINPKELSEFIDSMTNTQFEKIGGYVSNAPQMKHDVSFACEHCNTLQTRELRGIQDFF